MDKELTDAEVEAILATPCEVEPMTAAERRAEVARVIARATAIRIMRESLDSL